MAKVVGWVMLGVAAFCAYFAWFRISVINSLAEVGVVKAGAGFQVLLLVLCGVILPLGLGALLLRKPPKN
jgi:hypothetical protein